MDIVRGHSALGHPGLSEPVVRLLRAVAQDKAVMAVAASIAPDCAASTAPLVEG